MERGITLGLIGIIGVCEKHRDDVKSKSAREQKESEVGCRYFCLLQLPYFDAVRMLIIDPMHNLYMGTAKYIINGVWMKKNILTSSKR